MAPKTVENALSIARKFGVASVPAPRPANRGGGWWRIGVCFIEQRRGEKCSSCRRKYRYGGSLGASRA